MPFDDCPLCVYWDEDFQCCFNPSHSCPDPDDPDTYLF